MTDLQSNTPANDIVLVRKTVIVDAPQDIAFRVFTAEMATWWPMISHHIGETNPVAVVVEPKVGGRWFERGEDGVECEWGRVLTYEPHGHLALAWELSAEWKHDVKLQTVVDVQFIVESASRTRVELVHTHLEAYGARAEEMRQIFSSENGWSGMLTAYASRASAPRA